MKISYNWLQQHIEESLPSTEVVKEKIIFHAFEVESVEEKNGDTIFDIKILPDRAGDCYSHRGIARELCGLFGLTLKKEIHEITFSELQLPVEIQTDDCRRYLVCEIAGVNVGKSPEWLQRMLSAVGQKSINAVVDIGNFIMLDTGQPVHIFDADKIDGGVVVRHAKAGERIMTLSDEEKELAEGDVVIADYLGVLALAGIKGGKTAEVTQETKRILIEIADFKPVPIRKTSRRLNIITDASKRFENNIDSTSARDVAAKIAGMIQKVCGGTCTGLKDITTEMVSEKSITVTANEIQRILGAHITEKIIEQVLGMYAYSYIKDGDTYIISIPSYRKDIQLPADIAEEIGRVFGYEHVQAQTIPFQLQTKENNVFNNILAVKKYLQASGFSEVYTYSFRKKGDVYIAYGAKDKSALRTNLSEGLLESYEKNKRNAPLLGIEKVKIFEIGTVFQGENEQVHVGTVDNGTVQEMSLEVFLTEHPDVVPAEKLEIITSPQKFTPWSVYPFITRDIAVWVESDEGEKIIEKIVTDFAHNNCTRLPVLFDTFEKDGKKSIAYRFVFQEKDKTLTDEEVSKRFSVLIDKINAQKSLTIR